MSTPEPHTPIVTQNEDPYYQLSKVVEDVIRSEFADIEYIDIKHDRIHGALATDGIHHVGIYPGPQQAYGTTEHVYLVVQFYGPWLKDVNPAQAVDPRDITWKAHRLRTALGLERTTATSEMWFFEVEGVQFPPDGTGNKTRFEMSIKGWGRNTGIVETCG